MGRAAYNNEGAIVVERITIPILVINFKVYKESSGANAVKLARVAGNVAVETGACIVVCPPHTDLSVVANEATLHTWAQGADAVEPGGHTAHVTPEAIKGAGATGILINHSEKKLKISEMEYLSRTGKVLGLVTCICTNNVLTSVAAASFSPDFVAIEPPELIGGDISVTTADPAVVSNSVESVKKVNPSVKVLCGAGVKNSRDVRKAIELGSSGILVASGVIKAKDPEDAIRDLVSGL